MKRLRSREATARLLVCRGKTCRAAGGDEVARALRAALRAERVRRVRVTRTFCLGACSSCPVACAEGPAEWRRMWGEVKPKNAKRIARKLAKRLQALEPPST